MAASLSIVLWSSKAANIVKSCLKLLFQASNLVKEKENKILDIYNESFLYNIKQGPQSINITKTFFVSLFYILVFFNLQTSYIDFHIHIA